MKTPILSLVIIFTFSIFANGQDPVALCQMQVKTKRFEAAKLTCAAAVKSNPALGQMGLGLASLGLLEWQNAIAAFSAALDARGNASELYFYRGNANFLAGNYKAAYEDLSRASSLDPRIGARAKEMTDAAREIASLLPVKKVPVNVEKRSLEVSLTANSLLIQRALKKTNKEPKEVIDALDRQIVEKLNEAIRINKFNSHAYSSRASFYKAQNQRAKALIEYTKAIAVDPKSAPTIFSRGELYAEMKNYQMAIADFSTAIQINFEGLGYTSNYYSARADAYEKSGQKEKALQDLNYMIEVRPNEAFGYSLRASYHLRQNDRTKALADLNKAIEVAPKDASNRLSRCRFYVEAKNFSAAVADCTVAIDEKSFIISDIALTERAVAYTGLKKFGLAMADLATAEKSEYASKAEIYAQRGVIYAAQGKKAEAKIAFEAALKEDPKNIKAANGLKSLN
ncbi:MAG TPA: tetratricopeptide repeat protein [Pyrinomonadaceae bacterium]|nr:tetratricopeptide repeat protein [Pyrinomonadaceae bacterium]